MNTNMYYNGLKVLNNRPEKWSWILSNTHPSLSQGWSRIIGRVKQPLIWLFGAKIIHLSREKCEVLLPKKTWSSNKMTQTAQHNLDLTPLLLSAELAAYSFWSSQTSLPLNISFSGAQLEIVTNTIENTFCSYSIGVAEKVEIEKTLQQKGAWKGQLNINLISEGKEMGCIELLMKLTLPPLLSETL